MKEQALLLVRIITIMLFCLFIIYIYIKIISKINTIERILKWIICFCIIISISYLILFYGFSKEFYSCKYGKLEKIANLINNRSGQKFRKDLLPKNISYNAFKYEDKKLLINIKSSLLDKMLGVYSCFDAVEIILNEDGTIKSAKVDVF